MLCYRQCASVLTTATLRRHLRGAQTSLTYTLQRTQRPATSSSQHHRTHSCASLRQHAPRERSCSRRTLASSSQVRHRALHATAPIPQLWTNAAPGNTWDATASSDDAVVHSSAQVHMCNCCRSCSRSWSGAAAQHPCKAWRSNHAQRTPGVATAAARPPAARSPGGGLHTRVYL